MIYGAQPTYSLTDRKFAPANCQPLAARIFNAFEGKEGRDKLRTLLGKELEKSNRDIPGMRGFPVWMFVLDGDVVRSALDTEAYTTLPAVYLNGPANKSFWTNVEATKHTSAAAAEMILRHLTSVLF